MSKTVSKIQPEVIINSAALTDVDLCEAQPETAFLMNARSVSFLADAIKKTGSFLVQVSTDYVFNGEKGSYSENDSPSPINQYGLSKLKGEQATMSLGAERCCIARASVVYGWGREHRPNAVTYVYGRLSKGEKVSMVVDQYSSPTLNTNLAGMILEIAERKITGMVHTSGATRLNRYEFAVKIARNFGLDVALISPIKAHQLSWKAKRPKDSSLNITKASRTLSNVPLPIEQALRALSREPAITAK